MSGGRFRGWRPALGWCGGDKRKASDKARDFGYALFARGLYREGENDARCCLLDVEEGPVSVCRGHGVSMYVAATEIQAQVVLLFKLRVVRLGGVVT